jgi:hypothetical protein
MTKGIPQDLFSTALATLAVEDVPAALVTALTTALNGAASIVEGGRHSWYAEERLLARLSPYGTLTFFLPTRSPQEVPQRFATFDRQGRLLLLITWNADGTLIQFKVRNLNGRFLGVVRKAVSHLAWGESDCVWLLAGEDGFTLDRSLTLFRSVLYEDLASLPPLDAPAHLPVGGGSTILNVLALLAQDQKKATLRYQGPYPSERLFATLCESFRYSGEPGAMRERFTSGAEQAALQLAMAEPPVDWVPSPHERFFPAAHTCVQLRDGVEKVYDRGRVYYRSDLFASAYTIRVEQIADGQVHYVAGLSILGRTLEDHLVLDAQGGIVERPVKPPAKTLRGPVQFSDEWKAVLVRLIAAESTPLLRSELWPTIDQLTIEWGEVPGELWAMAGNDLVLHTGMIAVYREALAQIRSAGEGLLLAARFASELARLVGPLVRQRAQERLAQLSPADQQVSLLFAAQAPAGVSDAELRKFLTRLALAEELPTVA